MHVSVEATEIAYRKQNKKNYRDFYVSAGHK